MVGFCTRRNGLDARSELICSCLQAPSNVNAVLSYRDTSRFLRLLQYEKSSQSSSRQLGPVPSLPPALAANLSRIAWVHVSCHVPDEIEQEMVVQKAYTPSCWKTLEHHTVL